jgi:hypothetical protein
MIWTRKVEMTGDEFFYLLLTIYFKKRWIMLIWIWLLIFVLLFSSRINLLQYMLVGILVLTQLILIIQYWVYAHSKDNRIYLLPRYFEITEEQIVEWMDDGTSSAIKVERFIRVMRTGKCYLLFVAKNEYVYLPFSSFESEADMEWFNSEIVKKIGNK